MKILAVLLIPTLLSIPGFAEEPTAEQRFVRRLLQISGEVSPGQSKETTRKQMEEAYLELEKSSDPETRAARLRDAVVALDLLSAEQLDEVTTETKEAVKALPASASLQERQAALMKSLRNVIGYAPEGAEFTGCQTIELIGGGATVAGLALGIAMWSVGKGGLPYVGIGTAAGMFTVIFYVVADCG